MKYDSSVCPGVKGVGGLFSFFFSLTLATEILFLVARIAVPGALVTTNVWWEIC